MSGIDPVQAGRQNLCVLGKRFRVDRAAQRGDCIGAGGGSAERAVPAMVDTFTGNFDVAVALELGPAAMKENRVETGQTGARR